MASRSIELLAEAGLDCIPNEWEIVTVAQLLSADKGISVGVMYPGDHDPLGIPLIRSGDLNGNRINPNPDFRISTEKHAEYKRTALEGGELLLSLVGNLGQCAVAPRSMVGWNVARAVAVIRLANKADAEFVRLCLMSQPLQYLMNAWATTTVQATLNLKEIKQLPIPWPSKGERNGWVSTITALDNKIELNRRMNRTLESMVRAVFRELMKEESGKETTIGETVTIVGGSTPSTANTAFWEAGDINWTTPKDLAGLQSPFLLHTNSRITELGLQEISSGLLPIGTVLLSSRAPIGYLAITQIPTAINQGFIAIKCTNEAPNYFILNWLKDNMEEIIGRANGTTFLEISKSNFRPMKIIVPLPEKMKAFVETVEPLYQKIVANLKESRTLASLRDTLLPKLMRGEVRVKDVEKEL